MFERLGSILRRLLIVAAILALALVALFRFVNPPTNFYMLSERLRLGEIEHRWVSIDEMSEWLPLSAAAAEDANFCVHAGFDLDGIQSALADQDRLRGASTISQQVAKNVFLWPARSWLRKGLEAGFTVLIELTWPKRRIMEVYLNVAEFGEGVFGVEAAAEHYFKTTAAKMPPRASARLMTVLPDPKNRSPTSGTRYTLNRGRAIEQGATTLKADGRAACFL